MERFYPLGPLTAIIYGTMTFGTVSKNSGNICYRPRVHRHDGGDRARLIGSLSRGAACYAASCCAGLGVAIVGILLANARIYVVSAAVIAVASILLRRTSARTRLICCGAIAASLLLAFSNERMQRFTSLSDTDYVLSEFMEA